MYFCWLLSDIEKASQKCFQALYFQEDINININIKNININ